MLDDVTRKRSLRRRPRIVHRQNRNLCVCIDSHHLLLLCQNFSTTHVACHRLAALFFLSLHVDVVDIPKSRKAAQHRKHSAHDDEQWFCSKSVIQHQSDYEKHPDTHGNLDASAQRVLRRRRNARDRLTSWKNFQRNPQN